MMTRTERAVEYFMNGANCAQAVAAAFADLMGMDEKTVLRMTAPFGGGLARQREVCGAVSGMCMALGVLYGYGDREEMERCGADWIVPDVPALRKLLLSEHI